MKKQDVLQFERLTIAEKMAIKLACESSFEIFLRVFFQFLQGQRFWMNWHHRYECKLAEQVYRGEVNRLIVNVAPGSTKTEIWSIHWPAWCILKCITQLKCSSRWLPLSYSDSLVVENSSRVKEILDSEAYRAFWPLVPSKNTKAKHDWLYLDARGNKHRMFGTSIAGQVTGRRAGFMELGKFTGAMILDDPLPPKDAESMKLMDKSNKRLNRVVRSRLAHNDVPIVMVQQRLAKGDSTQFLLSDQSPDDYSVFRIPALINQEYIDSLPPVVRDDCIKDTSFSGDRVSYWPAKESTEALLAMEESDNWMFSAQYQQNPDDALVAGVIFKKEVDLLIKEQRFRHIPIEPALEVHSFWDLGINDTMVVWLMQHYGFEYRMIACYGNANEGMEHYINWLNDFKDQYKIRFGTHYAPHDIGVRDLMTKNSRQKTAELMGIKFKLVERCKSKRESINSLKAIFGSIFIDSTRCDTDLSGKSGDEALKTGWKAIKALRRQWDHDNECFTDDVGPKWATNYTDALQQMGLYFAPKRRQQVQQGARPSTGGWMGS